MPKIRKEFPVMRKEYESPMCKVVTVEKKDILTLSVTSFTKFARGTDGDFDNGYSGGYIGWGSDKW